MNDFKEMFNLIKSIYDGVYNKELKYEDFMIIFPKLKIINHHHFIDGLDTIQLIDELLKFKNNNMLERITEETVDLIEGIYSFQLYSNGIKVPVLNKLELLKYLILPYNMNKCEIDIDYFLYLHMVKFEILFSTVEEYLTVFGAKHLETLRRYNIDLYNIVLYINKYSEKIIKNIKERELVCTSIIRLFSIFYFKQDEYNNDYGFIDGIINNIIENEDYFVDYCDKEGIKTLYLTNDEANSIYRGLIKLLDEGYIEKKKRK